MSLYAIADLHLSLGEDKPMDVFEGWEGYIPRLEKNWRAVVRPEDTVVVAGDISWAMKLEASEQDFRFLNSLPGRKLLLKGNHDYWWSTRRKIETYFAEKGFNTLSLIHNSSARAGDYAVCGTRGWLYDAESAEDQKIVAREVGRLTLSLEEGKKLGGKPIVFLHYPPVYDGMECAEIMDVLVQHGISDCYYGHIHGSAAARRSPAGEYRGVKMHLISCDFLGFLPLLIR
jgi:hypothetical protein